MKQTSVCLADSTHPYKNASPMSDRLAFYGD